MSAEGTLFVRRDGSILAEVNHLLFPSPVVGRPELQHQEMHAFKDANNSK